VPDRRHPLRQDLRHLAGLSPLQPFPPIQSFSERKYLGGPGQDRLLQRGRPGLAPALQPLRQGHPQAPLPRHRADQRLRDVVPLRRLRGRAVAGLGVRLDQHRRGRLHPDQGDHRHPGRAAPGPQHPDRAAPRRDPDDHDLAQGARLVAGGVPQGRPPARRVQPGPLPEFAGPLAGQPQPRPDRTRGPLQRLLRAPAQAGAGGALPGPRGRGLRLGGHPAHVRRLPPRGRPAAQGDRRAAGDPAGRRLRAQDLRQVRLRPLRTGPPQQPHLPDLVGPRDQRHPPPRPQRDRGDGLRPHHLALAAGRLPARAEGFVLFDLEMDQRVAPPLQRLRCQRGRDPDRRHRLRRRGPADPPGGGGARHRRRGLRLGQQARHHQRRRRHDRAGEDHHPSDPGADRRAVRLRDRRQEDRPGLRHGLLPGAPPRPGQVRRYDAQHLGLILPTRTADSRRAMVDLANERYEARRRATRSERTGRITR
jgi:hypothetical protein